MIRAHGEFLGTLKVAVRRRADRKDHAQGGQEFFIGAGELPLRLVTLDAAQIHHPAVPRVVGDQPRREFRPAEKSVDLTRIHAEHLGVREDDFLKFERLVVDERERIHPDSQ